MTERMCLVLGLHVESTGFSIEEQEVRRRVWYVYPSCLIDAITHIFQVDNGLPEQPFFACL